jgi:hypothetical protein
MGREKKKHGGGETSHLYIQSGKLYKEHLKVNHSTLLHLNSRQDLPITILKPAVARE